MNHKKLPITRRSVLHQAGLAVAGAGLLSAPSMLRAGQLANASGANNRLRMGLIGCEGQGQRVAGELAKHGVEVVYVCDPDEKRCSQAKTKLKAQHAVADLRHVLDDKEIDLVAIATPDHWHGPAAILACQAGKHVYVEKPCSHNIREGRLMIEAARKYDRVMQVGSQCRSMPFVQHAIQMIREGAIGDVLAAKAWNSQCRKNIGHLQPSQHPAGFDYDLWVGPAPMRPFRKNCHHYTWHWWYDFGTGDAGNDGIHELDIAAWALGVQTHPSKVAGYAAKMFFDDDQQFPDTQYVTFAYPAETGAEKPRILTYEQRIWSPYFQENFENGVALYGTEGYMLLSKIDGWWIFGRKNELIKEETGMYSIDHHAGNFVTSIKTGVRPNADIEIGHRSTTLIHLANMIGRCGCGEFTFDPQRERITDVPEADALIRRTYREGHWAVPANA